MGSSSNGSTRSEQSRRRVTLQGECATRAYSLAQIVAKMSSSRYCRSAPPHCLLTDPMSSRSRTGCCALPQRCVAPSLSDEFVVCAEQPLFRELLKELTYPTRREYVSPFYIALIYVGLNEHAESLQWIQKAIDDRSNPCIFLRVDPDFDNLRTVWDRNPRADATGPERSPSAKLPGTAASGRGPTGP